MNAKESYAAVKLSIAKINILSTYLRSESNLSTETKKQWNLCLTTLNKMGQLAECLIENCNRTCQTINDNNLKSTGGCNNG